MSVDENKKGINFVVKSVPDETITMSLKNVPLVVALKAATDLAGMRYRVEPFAVVIVPRVEINPELCTRVFIVKPSFLSDSGLGRRRHCERSADSSRRSLSGGRIRPL